MQISLIIECENVNDVGVDRAGAVMQALQRQIAEVTARRGIKGEILVMYAAGLASAEQIRTAVVTALGPGCEWPVRAIACEGPPYQYYEQKNHAATFAQGDLLVYLDSDCIPQPAWLESLLAAFDRPEVNVCAGVTCIDRGTRYSRAFAYLVHWPIDDPEEEPVVVTTYFNANNVAFRRDVFLAHPYPDNGSYKARCVQLWQELARAGYTIHCATRAVVLHPAPVNMRHFVAKAVGLGHDYGLQLSNRKGAAPLRARLGFARDKWLQDFAATRARLRRARNRPDALTRATVFALAAVYFSIVAVTTVFSARPHAAVDRFLGLAARS